jgi:DNA-binding response OmpR family regulator
MTGQLLIVEDEEVVRDALAAYLSVRGFSVETAEDGEVGLRLASEQGKYDLVLTDLTMPKMDGLEFLHRLRAAGDNLPVIVMTGYATVENAVQALKEGAADFVTKPLHFEELTQTIGRILEQRARTLRKDEALRLADTFKFDLTYRSAEIDLRTLRYYLEEVLTAINSFSQVELTNIVLAFEEAVTNAHEHGNLELSSQLKSDDDGGWEVYDRLRRERLKDPRYADRKLHLQISWGEGCFELKVKDQGKGFDHRAWAPQADVSKCHGRGLTIIYGVMDEVTFNESGTEITMKKFAGPKR